MEPPSSPGRKAKEAERLRAFRKAHPEKQREYNRRWEKLNPDRRAEINRQTRERLGSDYWRERNLAQKAEMVSAYGGRCECCGETEITFLSLDHVLGGGTQHRKAVGNGRILRDLRDAGWPKGGYRVLCMNCQFGYRFGRTCPHQLGAAPAATSS